MKKPILVQWSPPQKGILKLNIDETSQSNHGQSGCGGVIRDSYSTPIFAFSEHLGWGSNKFAKMSALFSGLLFCYQVRISHIHVKSDSELLIRWFNKSAPTPWQLHELMDKIIGLDDFIDVTISHIYRENNFVVDGLTKQGALGCNMQYYFIQDLPPEIKNRWVSDMLHLLIWRQPKK